MIQKKLREDYYTLMDEVFGLMDEIENMDVQDTNSYRQKLGVKKAKLDRLNIMARKLDYKIDNLN